MRLALCAALYLAPAVTVAQCTGSSGNGSFSEFKAGLRTEAIARGIAPATADAFLRSVRHDPAVLKADRAQGVFQRPFIDFSRRLISQNRIDAGRANARKYASVFDRVEMEYGVDRNVLLAFWAFETDYGAFQGDFNTANALATLAHDCRRPELFRPQVFGAMELFARGGLDPATTTGAWAGEIGMVQMLPADILKNGVDGDGDGVVQLKTSVPDALMSGGKMLQHLGWRAGEPWLQEVTVPSLLDWSQSGLDTTLSIDKWQALGVRARQGTLPDLPASLILPQGHKGPAFLAFPNFNTYFEWNQSFTYVLTAAYFATRLAGAPVYDTGNPDPGLDAAQMKQLQAKLRARGHDVGLIDGILGAGTRSAVQAEQVRLGLPADAWPTRALLDRL
jgi:lytic murein transglycosylase